MSEHKLVGVEAEQASGQPPVRSNLIGEGQDALEGPVRETLERGGDDTLAPAFDRANSWAERSPYPCKGRSAGMRKVGVGQRARLLGLIEFSTSYIRELAAERLIDEAVSSCRFSRDGEPLWAPAAERLTQEDRTVPVEQGSGLHCGRYRLVGNPGAFSGPTVPGCHDTPFTRGP